MPTAARKSSLGTSRRGPGKYIPYRADDYQHGKRTGIAVGYVDHLSDEFEPFDQVMNQADKRTPPKVQGVRRKRLQKTPVVEREESIVIDEMGEMSMELEESLPNSPAAYFTATQSARITSSVQRVGSSSRPVQRTSDVDFDRVPSPRASSTFARKSLGASRSAGPSRLSRSSVALDEDDGHMDVDDGGNVEAQDFNNNGFDDDDDDDDDGVVLDDIPQLSPRRSSYNRSSFARRASFAALDQEEEDDIAQVEGEMGPSLSPEVQRNANKSSVREQPHHGEDAFEEDIEGMDEIDHAANEVEEQESEEEAPRKRGRGRPKKSEDSTEHEQPVSKKARTENDSPKKPRGRPRKETVQVLRDVTPNDNNPQGLRRGQRTRYAPLEWWRLEKVVYGRRESGTSFVPTIKEIRRLPKEEPQPLGAKKRKRRAKSKAKSVTVDVEASIIYNPEEGWDDATDASGVILDYMTGKEVKKRLACTAKMVQPKPAANSNFYFQRIFGDGKFIAAGQLIIPPNGQKPTKGTHDNTFVFYVIEGAVNYKIHETSFIIATGGMFLVPRGNMYFIQNISDRDARLFFAQARQVSDSDSEEEDDPRRSFSMQRTPKPALGAPAPRSSSDRAQSELKPMSKRAASARA